ncbi:hypothetical protein L1987_18846 [Smallanthus sonchifolius]|uniref:Uncharacterized protein n=1 Tax=Smallanthus sonchifolius TaxID=185202 RepID=A0ACB9J1V4_9ASTR|nr:hypothetical protein L1987_18846 [Smallanthus sonchifolius]
MYLISIHKLVVPLIQGYEDAGDFSGRERLKTSIHVNLIFYLILGLIGLFGLTLLIMMQKDWFVSFHEWRCNGPWLPKSIWRNTDWTTRQKVLSHKIAKMAVKLEAHQELSNHSSEATSKQMSKQLIWRCIVWKQLKKLFAVLLGCMSAAILLAEATLLPNGVDLSVFSILIKSLVTQEMLVQVVAFVPVFYMCICSYYSLFKIELIWRCIVWKQLKKLFAVLLGCMSAAILLAEATLLTTGVDLYVFSILINSLAAQEMLVQVVAFVPLFYMCICSFYSLFKIVESLVSICLRTRYAPPISFNFLNLISLDGEKKTIFKKRMGNIDNTVPFFGKGFNKLYPVIMVVYTLLVASGFFHRIIKVGGIWKRIIFQNEADDLDGVDPSRLFIMKKERAWLEQGHNIGEGVVPLTRNFNDTSIDIESGNISTDSWPGIIATDGPSSLMSSTWLSVKSGLQNLKAKNKYTQLHDSSEEIFHKLKQPDRDENELDDLVGSCDEDGEWKLAMPAFLQRACV